MLAKMLFYNIQQLTIMHLALRQNPSQLKQGFFSQTKNVQKPRFTTEEQMNEEDNFRDGEDDTFNLLISERRPQDKLQMRMIKKSMINRSCINTLNYNCKGLDSIPRELCQKNAIKLEFIQKLDLSFNNISDIHDLLYEDLVSLKELLLNGNVISELPYKKINLCKGLRLLNLSNNQLYIFPALTRVNYVEAKGNPFRIVTSELVNLHQIQFLTMDWLDYLIDSDSRNSQEKQKDFAPHYNNFKVNILEKINYQIEENRNYCDFHCYFAIRIDNMMQKDRELIFLSQLLAKSIYKSDNFFINYLKDYQNQLNYAKLTYNSKLMLQIALESNNKNAIELFMLKKNNYLNETSDNLYFESLRLSCHFSNYQMFRYLFHIKIKRKKIQTKGQIAILLGEIIQRFDRQKSSDNILSELTKAYKELSLPKFLIKIPNEFNSKTYKSMSLAILYIYQNEQLLPFFQIEAEEGRTTPLHFAMKSRNEQLLKQLLLESWDVFERNEHGTVCKFMHGSTQISRKMIWKREKALIRNHWLRNKPFQSSNFKIDQSTPKIEKKLNFETPSKSKVSIYSSQYDLESAGKLSKLSNMSSTSNRKLGICRPLSELKRKCALEEEILPNLAIRAKEIACLKWENNYSKMMISMDSMAFSLQRLNLVRQGSFMKRVELWKKVTDQLSQAFDTVREQNIMAQYEIIHAAEMLNVVKRDDSVYMVKTESHRFIMEGNGFWCCQNIGYQP